jgi:hypothetical protein
VDAVVPERAAGDIDAGGDESLSPLAKRGENGGGLDARNGTRVSSGRKFPPDQVPANLRIAFRLERAAVLDGELTTASRKRTTYLGPDLLRRFVMVSVAIVSSCVGLLDNSKSTTAAEGGQQEDFV